MFGNGISWEFPFLPYGAEMLYSQNKPNQPFILLVDLDKDGKNELLGVYRLNQQLFLFVLHEHFGHIRLISAEVGHGYQLSYLGTAHIKSPEKLSIVVGWQMDPIWSKLEIFDYKRLGLREVKLNGDFAFSKIEIEDMPGGGGRDGKDEIALWLPGTGNAYHINIYRWENGKLVRARDVEPYYFKKVAAYYRQNDPLQAGLMRTVYLFPACLKKVGGKKWGYIDVEGRFHLPTLYDRAEDFQENDLAIVTMADQDGIIDSKGHFILKPKYESIHPFVEGRALVYDHQGYKVIDETGREILSKPYSYISDFKEGRAIVANHSQNHELYGYINRRGKEIIPIEYQSAGPFSDGKAVVKLNDGEFALINLTGKMMKKYHYPFVGDYSEGLMPYKQIEDGDYGYMDEQGTIKIKPQFSGAQVFTDGRAIVYMNHDYSYRYGLINKQGQYVIKPNYNSMEELGEKRYALGKAIHPDAPYAGSMYAVVDAEGRLLTGFIYTNVTKYQDGFASASTEKSTFFIDLNGKRVGFLPMVEGEGTLQLDRTLIKGNIDYRLFYLTRQGALVWKQNTVIPLRDHLSVIEHKYKPNKDYLVYYPQINGLPKVNIQLKQMAGVKEIPSDVQLESTFFGDFEVSFFKGNLLVMEINGYDFPFGAAHGMPVRTYPHINVETDEMYQLKDLFKADADYVGLISKLIGNMIKSDQQYSYVFPGSYKGIAKDQLFFLDEAGLNIIFPPYEIGPYAAGFIMFTIPLEKLEQIIDYTGGLWLSFH